MPFSMDYDEIVIIGSAVMVGLVCMAGYLWSEPDIEPDEQCGANITYGRSELAVFS